MKNTKGWVVLILSFGFIGTALAGWITSGRDMYSDVSGNVGIGTTKPQQKLHVSGLAQFDLPSGRVCVSTPGGWPGLIAFSPNGHRRDVIICDQGIRIEASPSASSPPAGNGIFLGEDGNVLVQHDLTVGGKLVAKSLQGQLQSTKKQLGEIVLKKEGKADATDIQALWANMAAIEKKLNELVKELNSR